MCRKHNGLELINNLEENLKTLNELEEKQEDIGPLQLFKNTVLLRLVCLVAVIWSVNDYFYIAGSLNAENLHGDIWLNFSLVALTELPAVFVGTFLMERLGRRWVHCAARASPSAPSWPSLS